MRKSALIVTFHLVLGSVNECTAVHALQSCAMTTCDILMRRLQDLLKLRVYGEAIFDHKLSLLTFKCCALKFRVVLCILGSTVQSSVVLQQLAALGQGDNF